MLLIQSVKKNGKVINKCEASDSSFRVFFSKQNMPSRFVLAAGVSDIKHPAGLIGKFAEPNEWDNTCVYNWEICPKDRK